MVIELLLLIFIIWAVFIIIQRPDRGKYLKNEIDEYIDMIEDVICKSGYIIPQYNIINSNHKEGTYTVFKNGKLPTIHLCMINEKGIQYDDNTIKIALLHEIAHILCPNPKHDHPFDDIENTLLRKANELLYIDLDGYMDNYYPCKTEI